MTQLCDGTRAGIKGAVHALNELFKENQQNKGGDVANAFKSLNRIAAL